MTVRIELPDALAAAAGGRTEVLIDVDGSVGIGAGTDATTVTQLFDRLGAHLPTLERRVRDERGGDTPVPDGAVVQIIASVSGG